MSKIHLTIVDGQWDFCHEGEPGYDPTHPDPNPFVDTVKRNGNLYVKGASNDMKRLAQVIDKCGKKIDDIKVTMDSHRTIHIAHSDFWRDDSGNMPQPYTVISKVDVVGKNPKWHPYNPADQKWCEEYVAKLEQKGRNALCIWPKHCLIGSHGWQVYPPLYDALKRYEEKEWATVTWLVKGDDSFTEWYSAVMADVQTANPRTSLNTDFVDSFKDVDLHLFGGEALSHCVKSTFDDIFRVLGDEAVKKFMLITDATSPVPVPCFIKDAEDFVKKYTAIGMKTCTCADLINSGL